MLWVIKKRSLLCLSKQGILWVVMQSHCVLQGQKQPGKFGKSVERSGMDTTKDKTKDRPKGFCRWMARDHATWEQLGGMRETGPCCLVSQCLMGTNDNHCCADVILKVIYKYTTESSWHFVKLPEDSDFLQRLQVIVALVTCREFWMSLSEMKMMNAKGLWETCCCTFC